MNPKMTIFWVAVCTVPCSILTVIAFKLAGVEPGGWSGGIGAGIGVICGHYIAAKRDQGRSEDDTSANV